MTLSRFLREYVYIPLGGNRRGEARRYANLAATMAIGGLWHGAAWTFVIWGVLHGCYLTLNHFWRAITQHRFSPRTRRLFRPFGWLLTFVAVVIAWVFFRANDVSTAWEFLRSMAGLNGVVFPSQWETHLGGVPDWLRPGGFAFGDLQYFNRSSRFNRLVLFLLIVTLAPNTHQIMAACNPTTALPFAASSPRFFVLTWRPSLLWMLVALGIGLFGVTSITGFSEFIYFNF